MSERLGELVICPQIATSACVCVCVRALVQSSFEAHSSLQAMAKRFCLDACEEKPLLEPPMKIPRASDVNTNAVLDIPPPAALLERLGNPPIIIGFDIATASDLGKRATVCSPPHVCVCSYLPAAA